MRLKYTLILAAILLIFGLPNVSQPYAKVDDLKSVYDFEFGKENRIVAENGAVLRCSIQSKKSSARVVQGAAVAISVNANWICR